MHQFADVLLYWYIYYYPKKRFQFFFFLTQFAINDLQYLPQPCGRGPSGSNSLLAVAANWSCN